MVRIRLSRRGKKNQAYFHIVAVDSRKKRDGAVLDTVGSYDPAGEKSANKLKLNRELYDSWLAKGALPSETVLQIVASQAK